MTGTLTSTRALDGEVPAPETIDGSHEFEATVVLSVGAVLPLCVAGPASSAIASETVFPATPFCGVKIRVEDLTNARLATLDLRVRAIPCDARPSSDVY